MPFKGFFVNTENEKRHAWGYVSYANIKALVKWNDVKSSQKNEDCQEQ